MSWTVSPPTFCLALPFLMAAVSISDAHCPKRCNGHGICGTDSTCSCDDGFIGPDCSERSCPTGRAWIGFATSTDTLHILGKECSGIGKCNRATGMCSCHAGFGGIACQRMLCPNSCSGHGQCMSMREAALYQDDKKWTKSYSYNLWDADMIHGCVCDDDFSGYDCSLRDCITGDDPLTVDQADEMQILNCKADGGSFTLTFRDETTTAIAHNAVLTTSSESTATATGTGVGESLESKLEALTTISGVTVAAVNSETTACGGSDQSVKITFTHEHGDLPVMLPITTSLTLASGSVVVTVSEDGVAGTAGGTSIRGTKEDRSCNGRGLCTSSTGLCGCYSGFVSSDGQGSAGAGTTGTVGTFGDCGAKNPSITISTCPGATICSDKGVCSGSPTYTCTCNKGFTGGDCSQFTCPNGVAWFDEASADDTAHGLAECSNMGHCDRSSGVCTCQDGFEGATCDRMSCPKGGDDNQVCSGRGTCHVLNDYTRHRKVNGVSQFFTYGDTPAKMATWDAQKFYACLCDKGLYENDFSDWSGYDCTHRTCPTGDDPLTIYIPGSDIIRQANEKQTIRCTATSGSFTVTFREEVSASIPYNAQGDSYRLQIGSKSSCETAFGSPTVTTTEDLSASLSAGDIVELVSHNTLDARNYTITGSPSSSAFTVTENVGMLADMVTVYKVMPNIKAILEQMTTIEMVNVNLYAAGTTTTVTSACASNGVDIDIEFLSEFGDLPMMTTTTSLSNGGTAVVFEQIKGSKENEECSNRGKCDRELGVCSCFDGYRTSDNHGKAGTRGDCGAADALAEVGTA